MRFPPNFSPWIRPAFRLRTLMVIVVVASLGLAWEIERRKSRERQRLALIADGRRSLVVLHESNARAIRAQVATSQNWIKNYEDFRSGRSRQPWIGNGREALRRQELQQQNVDLAKKAEWEDAMARNATWAADHPAEPWPARPPEPVPSRVSTATVTRPAPPELPEGPSRPKVPTIVKKNQ